MCVACLIGTRGLLLAVLALLAIRCAQDSETREGTSKVAGQRAGYLLGSRTIFKGVRRSDVMDGDVKIVELGSQVFFYALTRNNQVKLFDTTGAVTCSLSVDSLVDGLEIGSIFSVVIRSDSSLMALIQADASFFVIEGHLFAKEYRASRVRTPTSLQPYALPTLLDIVVVDERTIVLPLQYSDHRFEPGNSKWLRKFSSPCFGVFERIDSQFIYRHGIGEFPESFSRNVFYYDVDGSIHPSSDTSVCFSFLFEDFVHHVDLRSRDTLQSVRFDRVDEQSLVPFDFNRIHDAFYLHEYYYYQPRYKYLWVSGDTTLRLFVPSGVAEHYSDDPYAKNWDVLRHDGGSDVRSYHFKATRFRSDQFLVQNSSIIWLHELDSDSDLLVLRRVLLQ